MSLSSKSKTIDKSLSTSTPSNSSSTSSNLYRNLIWSGSIPICITISSKDLPSNADLTIIDSYYLQLPRISYLPLYLNQIRKYFLDLVLDESSNAALNDDEIWFEFNGIPLKWYVFLLSLHPRTRQIKERIELCLLFLNLGIGQ